ncbi:glycogen synthase GlgA [Novosphingobium pentaromativorans]|uniref:Glycogen synthase n=1 Tax=Novosphingobium pentaromativorans US6-1 TaxID=1088721 RepID=G6EE84_9SPHN|nr:glycogen synthase GlgA [Novosphingobium pentaromativorans]AIT79513.1 glycogen synthase [Novosphingobium pentaromativorans US6-1]EHJ60307.1 starch synthase [Novosphingobium pentaromativorans US6-1]
MTLKVLSVASEAVPLIKTGGLADVAGALPGAVADHDVAMTTLLPGYPSVLKAMARARAVHQWDSLLGSPARLLSGKIGAKGAEHPLLVLDAPELFTRDGTPYSDVSGKDWNDNWRRFAALGRAAADIAGGAMVRRGKPQGFDLVHAHDWQAAMACAYLRFAPYGGARIPSVVTIHNMAFQGWFGREIFAQLGLPPRAWTMDGVEYHGGVGMLKAGLASADAVTTVSPTYAREIRSGTFGMGLEGLIIARGNAVSGILNGIDTDVWNPATDKALASSFTARTLERRMANKRALEADFDLDEDDGPLFIVVSRLTWQKGMDVLPEVLDHLVGIGGRLALLGSADPHIEHQLFEGAARHPGRIGIRIGYDEDLSHRMQGGGDAILVPSRFEPCGLTQLYGLAYGCIPVVSRTGGLADTVIDANPAALAAGCATGIQHDGVTYDALAAALTRTVDLYRQPEVWQKIQKNAMKCDFSWKASGKAYADLYRSLIA